MRKYLDADIVFETSKRSRCEWLNARKSGIGGSDASSVLGLNPHRSSISVYLEKIRGAHIANDTDLAHASAVSVAQSVYVHGENTNDKSSKEAKGEEVSYRMELGNKLEDFVAREFSEKTGKKVRNVNGILKNEKYPFALANIDRAIVGEKAFLECKVTNSYAKTEWRDGVPIHYQIQCHHYMAVTGATHCYVAALIGNEELAIHKIDRDEEIIKDIMDLEQMFWHKCVLGGELPAPDGSSDYSKVLQGLYKDSKDEVLILFEEDRILSNGYNRSESEDCIVGDMSTANFLNRYDDVVGLIKELDTEKKAIEQYIQGQMQDYEIAYLGDRKISWKKQSRSIVDTKSLKKEHPELVADYTKTTTSRVFRIS
ncbi:MAG: YqaJ viral recombinase family protein [Peptostreptococcaceae bacterium]